MTDTLVMIAGLLADEAPKDTGPDFGKASPFGLLIVVLLLIGTFLLVRSMNRHLKRLPESFDRKNPQPDQAVDDGTVEPGPTRTPTPRRPDALTGNTLVEATSPYLRQHADNPVHWRQWTPDALAEAAQRDVPILLSIGYAACHWCHVMAHESFEDDEVAAAMNAGFVCIKVDREERPDIDAVYMNATVALTGQGGWPMTCFLTPDGRPFFCGTYYPKPNFLQLLAAVSDTWRSRRDEVEQASDQIIGELRSMASGLPGGGPEVAARAVRPRGRRRCCATRTPSEADSAARPSFRPSALLEALLRSHERTGEPAPLAAVERTATAMARGGIYDQLAGGFARYSVDASWVVPHFEKMLYDNALLLRAYAHWARRTGNPLARKVTDETARFMIDELSADGMFISSLDADADGKEGLTYVWTPAQLTEVLGDGRRTLGRSGFRRDRGGHLRARQLGAAATRGPRRPRTVRPGQDRAAGRPVDPAAARPRRQGRHGMERVGDHRAGRGERRAGSTRIPRRRNAMRAGGARPAHRGRPAAPRQPRRAGRRQRRDPRGLRDAGHRAAHAAPDHRRRRSGCDAATGLLDTALEHFADPERPGRWFDTADDAEQLLVRPADPLDGATPSGASSITEALLTAAHLVPAPRADRYAAAAAEALSTATPVLARLPRSAGHWLAVAEAAVRGPIQIAVATDGSDSPLLSRRPRVGARRRGGGRRRGELLGAAGRPRPGRRRRCRLRVPRPGVRPAGHHRRGSRVRLGRVRVAFGACRRPKTTPRPSTATSNSPPKARSTTSSSCTRRTAPSRIRSAARCTSAERRFAGSIR